MDSERSSPRAGQTPRAPISLEGERRKAMKLVYTMEKHVETFREKWLLDETDENSNEWLEFINMAKGKHDYKSIGDFEKDLDRLKHDRGYLGSRVLTITQLQKVCERAKAFDTLYENSYQRVEDALYQYMGKYCHSYFAELEELDVYCVREYENNINEWQKEIEACLKEAESAMDDYVEIMDISFSEYIGSYGQVLRCMHATLDALVSVCDPFRSWVSADEGYIKRVRLELECLQRQRVRLTEILRKDNSKIEEARAKGLRTSFLNKKLGLEVQGRMNDRSFCRKREFSFVDKIEMTENILHEKKLELDEAMGRLQSRPIHSLVREPSDGIKDKTARLHQEVNRLEKQVKRMKRGRRDMKETRYHLQKDYHYLKGSYESSLKKVQRDAEEFKGQVKHARDVTEELRTVERKIKALRRIIEVKTHPDTVKKIFFNGYTAGEKMDFRDTLREAIDVAAAGVGKDWDKMYHLLPFNPPRNPLTRSLDLEAMDMDFRSVHPPTEMMALRSLDKWKSLSKVTSVNALVRTLKSIKKNEVAKKIEKQILTVVN